MGEDFDIADLRRSYHRSALDPDDVDPDPIVQFSSWLAEAVAAGSAAGITEPNAMTLATADADGTPSARTVLLKGIDADGFTFFTNLGSRKARELDANPRAALVFAWLPLERQVTVAGPVTRVPDADADAYFASRPLGSQLGAWASRQSTVIASRAVLEAARARAEARVVEGLVPRPPFWGGYRLAPSSLELWQGRPDRLHDRVRYRREAPHGPWVRERLSP
jgi:pyridoxamine 5'-phosphate oxidase